VIAAFISALTLTVHRQADIALWSGGPRFLFIPFGLGAALTFVSLVERGTPFVVALAATLAVMIALGIIVERAVLQPLINQPPITLFIATLGLSYIIEGVAQLLWGTQVHELDIGISKIPFDVDGCVFISWFDLFAAAVAGSLVALFTPSYAHRRLEVLRDLVNLYVTSSTLR
jgi:branched-subunit amino acid ABC-type transport system permease component